MTPYEHVLWPPLRFGAVGEAKNRIATSPMLSHGYPRRVCDPRDDAFYQAFARGGAGLVNIGVDSVDGEFGIGHCAIDLGSDGRSVSGGR